MNTENLHQLLLNPSQVQGNNTRELKMLIEQYPYMQSLRSLYLKALFINESTSYNQELKMTAAYTLDRDILFNFIISNSFVLYQPQQIEEPIIITEQLPKEPEQNISNLLQSISKVAFEITQEEKYSEESSATIEEIKAISPIVATENEVEDKIESILPNTINVEKIITSTNEETKQLEENLKIGEPLQFNTEEKYSFHEWLKLSKQQPIVRNYDSEIVQIEEEKEDFNPILESKNEELKNILEKKQALIDQFIKTNPKITPVKKSGQSPINIELSTQENTSLMTETLAKIYLEQKKYQKAIQAYEILILKYPEKSSFFANQILDIKALQQHNSL